MLLNYGRGRFEQLYKNFNKKNLIFTLPAFFSIYILLLPIILAIYLYTKINYIAIYFIPAIIYLTTTVLAGVIKSIKEKGFIKKILGIFVYPFMFFITHLFYGLGFFYAVFRIITGYKRVTKFNINKYKSFS